MTVRQSWCRIQRHGGYAGRSHELWRGTSLVVRTPDLLKPVGYTRRDTMNFGEVQAWWHDRRISSSQTGFPRTGFPVRTARMA